MEYFNPCESINYKKGNDIESILETVALHYIGNNPATECCFRLGNENGFKRGQDYCYIFDFDQKYPEAQTEEVVYTWGKVWSDETREALFLAAPKSPMTVYFEGEMVYKSDYMAEKTSSESIVKVNLQSGWNDFIICFTKTLLGFGGKFGTKRFKNFPYHFVMPLKLYDGQEGWAYTKPSIKIDEIKNIVSLKDDTWFPKLQWQETDRKHGQLFRMYGLTANMHAYGWCKGEFIKFEDQNYQIKGFAYSPLEIFIDGKSVKKIEVGEFSDSIVVPPGIRDIVVACYSGMADWGYQLDIENCKLISAFNVKGSDDPWAYAGPFSNEMDSDISLEKFSYNSLVFSASGADYWRVDCPGGYVRPFLENKLFGKWNYPLGVTLYGLVKTGNAMGRPDIVEYVRKHVELSTGFYEYSLWDKNKYGASGINNQLSAIDSLDDCGSFASMMLEVGKVRDIENIERIAADVAIYISKKQPRLADGTLYRATTQLESMQGTLWADDLYMCIPFLCRYYKFTKNIIYLNDAVQQCLSYKKHLYIPEKKLMSHVYYTKEELVNQIPWGRGNGWVIFALSELLAVLPENHKEKSNIVAFFQELAEGYLGLQDEDGMWHQVLTDEESYQESSCTSMFIYAFSRGVQNGWLKKDKIDVYIEAVFKGWKGLSKKAIDKNGNVYGICQGSGHSFTANYYKNELSWVLNDPHGIGIVLLAGIETLNLKKFLVEN